ECILNSVFNSVRRRADQLNLFINVIRHAERLTSRLGHTTKTSRPVGGMALSCAGQMKVGELDVFQKVGLIIQEQVAGTRLKIYAPRRIGRKLCQQRLRMDVLTAEPSVGMNHDFSLMCICSHV